MQVSHSRLQGPGEATVLQLGHREPNVGDSKDTEQMSLQDQMPWGAWRSRVPERTKGHGGRARHTAPEDRSAPLGPPSAPGAFPHAEGGVQSGWRPPPFLHSFPSRPNSLKSKQLTTAEGFDTFKLLPKVTLLGTGTGQLCSEGLPTFNTDVGPLATAKPLVLLQLGRENPAHRTPAPSRPTAVPCPGDILNMAKSAQGTEVRQEGAASAQHPCPRRDAGRNPAVPLSDSPLHAVPLSASLLHVPPAHSMVQDSPLLILCLLTGIVLWR